MKSFLRPSCILLGLSLCGLVQAASGPWLERAQLDQIPTVRMQASAQPAAQAPARALNYAQTMPLRLDSRSTGQWTQDGADALWRLRLESENAVNLSVTLGRLELPEHAELRLYDGAGYLWQGPFTHDALMRHERFWSPLVPGPSLLLELRIPAIWQQDTSLEIQALHHGYRDLRTTAKSGSCNIDVACSRADPWTDASRATARITIGGRRLCSAVLLNNTRNDGTPLLLTARHCGIGESDEFPPSSVVVYWNYETSQCGGDPNGSLRQNQTGSSLLAEGAAADFSLVRLDQAPPAAYQVYYAGWDARGLTPTSGVSTHHPSGDEKRISFFDEPASAQRANVDGQPVESWSVRWSAGVTEAGSSGAGLWDSSHRVIGQLSGGNSSCSNPQGSDVFGRLDVAWDEGSSPAGRLQPWLDPDNNGIRALDGLDSGAQTLAVQNDRYLGLPADRQQVRLDVLSNDGGQWPLQVLQVEAEHGQVAFQGADLIYTFAPGQDSDTLRYQLVNRWGETASAEVRLDKRQAPLRGGALGWFVIVLLLGRRAWR